LTPEDLDRVALVDPGDRAETTFGQLRAQVDAFGGALAARGVEVGTVLGVLCPNVPAFATVFHGALRIGATLTTINSLYTAAKIVSQQSDAQASGPNYDSKLLQQDAHEAATAGISDGRLSAIDGVDECTTLQRTAPRA